MSDHTIFDVHKAAVFCDDGGKQFRPEQPSIVLLHGALNDHSVWSLQSRALAAQGVNVLAPDLPGHGRSAGAALSSIEALADWLLALLDAANLPAAVIAGHSMGALIALEAAHRAPRRVRKLALAGATWPMRVAPGLLEAALHDTPAAIGMVTAWSHAPGAPAASIAATRALMEHMAAINPAQLLHTDLNACNAYVNGEAAARSVSCPTCFIVGSFDKMTPSRSSAALRAALPHASTVEVAAGHQMMVEQPEAVLAALRALLIPA